MFAEAEAEEVTVKPLEGQMDIPTGVTTIKSYAFSSCDNLSKIIIPKTVNLIEKDAISNNGIITIYGYTGSEAEKYAMENKVKLVVLDGETTDKPSETTVTTTKAPSATTAITTTTKASSVTTSDVTTATQTPTETTSVSTTKPEIEFMYGDIDGNGKIEISDLTWLSLYMLQDCTLSNNALKAADVNGDCAVNLADLAYLKQYICKDDVVLGPVK